MKDVGTQPLPVDCRVANKLQVQALVTSQSSTPLWWRWRQMKGSLFKDAKFPCFFCFFCFLETLATLHPNDLIC